ncbi:type VI secretion system-associated FHA domain protein TagH [Roseibium sp. SCPC15]|uniref:type VI secretion system-associated FHA domain protein TagH n=1 Tax=Roseibium sp. SCP15 TaxID=3141376 RepID=UPI00333D5A8F
MRITLQIENVDRLETGGQVSYSCTDRGFDIGRHEHLDWSLPDPQRIISGKHCEIRFEDGQFVLYDISTNGTFLNGSPNRLDRAHVLRSGDRIMIGDYVIAVSLEVEENAGAGSIGHHATSHQSQSQPWDSPAAVAPAPPMQSSWPEPPSAGSPSEGNPWGAPSVGMEGRHAPPSATPGVGTPADDVWGSQGHGWGHSDPALYDPQSPSAAGNAPRPAQADPLDHLAQQPHLQEPAAVVDRPSPQRSGAVSADQPASDVNIGGANAPEPLFKMPDLAGEPSESKEVLVDVVNAEPPSREVASPFPEAPDWSRPENVEQSPEDEPSAAHTEEAGVSQSASAMPPVSVVPEKNSQPNAEDETPNERVSAGNVDILKAFAEGAGIPVSVLDGREPEEFARELGGILQEMTSDLMGLLQARSQVKAMTRNANRTLISRSGNNALKFSPTPQMALQTMLGQNAEENGYLPLAKAMTLAFKDIQKHHVWTYAAMQKAAARFDATLSPSAIEGEGQISKSAFGNQKAKLWDRMQERWTSLSGAYDDGLVGVFTQYFTESYEELSSDGAELTGGEIE